jgi:hypothetical protein
MKVVHTSGLRIATLSGHVATLEADVPIDLPEFLGILALGQGAKQVTEGDEPVVVIPVSDPSDPTPETRHQKLVRIMCEIITAGDTTSFRQDGQPKSSVLNRLFGEPVLEDERVLAWDEATRKL